MSIEDLRAPFPWFGGKLQAASLIWERFGSVNTYVEPFFGSGAVLFGRALPVSGTEIVNDLDGFVTNFWRAIKHDPAAVAHHVDWPMNQCDRDARKYWLLTEGSARLSTLLGNPDGFDARIAGWWCYCLCSSIVPKLNDDGPWFWDGNAWRRRDKATNDIGIRRQLPSLSSKRGIHRVTPEPFGSKTEWLLHWFGDLAKRLRDVVITCTDWQGIVDSSALRLPGITAVFLDPPYLQPGREITYRVDSMEVAQHVAAWAREAGKRPDLRICLAGYEGNYEMPPDWRIVQWKSSGGFSNARQVELRKSNRETLWFSPACLSGAQLELFNSVSSEHEA